MNRSLTLILLFFFTLTTAVAQNRTLKKANAFYEQKAYSEAILLYERLIKSDSSNKNSMVLSKLGDCYRLTNNINGQLLCYGSLVERGEAEPIQELYYGEALLQNGEAEKANTYFEKYSADERGKQRALSLSKAASYTRNADAYMINPAAFNSPQSDFCAVKFFDGVVFASTRKRGEWIKKEQGWTNGNFVGLYTTELNDMGEQMPVKPFTKELNSKYSEGPLCFNATYTKLFYTRNNALPEELAKDSTFKLAVYEAALEEYGFGDMKKLPFENKDYNYAHPSVSANGYTLYFASDMEGGKGGMDIYVTYKDSSGAWSEPENLGDNVNTAGNELFPFIASNNVLYFASNGHDGLGGLDIYEAPVKNGKISKIYNMGEPVNSKSDDFGIFLNEDNKSGYISSNRKNGGMDDDIYNLIITREVRHGKDVLIYTKDKAADLPVPNVKVLINNNDTIVTDEKGEYTTSVEEDSTLTFITFSEDYFQAYDSLITANVLNETLTKEIALEKDPKLFLQGLITDATSGNPLDSVNIRVTDINTGERFDPYSTTASGTYYRSLPEKRIGDKITYLLRMERRGYLQRSVIFSHDINAPGEINMNEKNNLTLGRVAVGMDLAKMIDIKPIYFDLGKSTIRKDAATELDKVVQVMNEYPNMIIELGSHTDCRSGAASNLKLSAARAQASVAYIIKRGISKNRITGKGYGETKLLNNCACEGKVQSTCSEEEHAENRRTEFIITKLK